MRNFRTLSFIWNPLETAPGIDYNDPISTIFTLSNFVQWLSVSTITVTLWATNLSQSSTILPGFGSFEITISNFRHLNATNKLQNPIQLKMKSQEVLFFTKRTIQKIGRNVSTSQCCFKTFTMNLMFAFQC